MHLRFIKYHGEIDCGVWLSIIGNIVCKILSIAKNGNFIKPGTIAATFGYNSNSLKVASFGNFDSTVYVAPNFRTIKVL